MPAIRFLMLSVLVAILAVPTAAQQADPSVLTTERIFGSAAFGAESFGPARWLDGTTYTTVEPSPSGRGQDIVRYQAATGAREVVVAAARLTPAGQQEPLDIEDYAWSPDRNLLLVFTNSRQVWRTNTRGDYWLLNRTTGQLRKLGAFAPPSTLMFAKFSPAGDRAGYVVENNLFVEDLASGTVTQLTRDGSRTIINGTFDWVYEEELGLQDGWRWSPDGKRIAYWQLTADRVRDFLLIRNTDSLYSRAVPIQYPKAGEENSAARIGVVDASGGQTTWLAIEGDPRNQYLARMDWTPNRDELVVQRLNRLQNTMDVLLADARTGAARTVHTERDSAWVEVVTFGGDMEFGSLVWLDGGGSFLLTSERDGWNHVYRVSRETGAVSQVTAGAFDVISVAGADPAGGWLYYIASPDNPAQRYLWRTRLDGKGAPERLTPSGAGGTHGYTIAPGFRYAFHDHSRFGVPPVTSLVALPDHRSVRVLAANESLAQRVAALARGPVEFLTVPGADGVELKAWLMKPPDFDPAKKYPVLLYVYGGPGSQRVTDDWDGSRYLWHVMLTQKGYLVASVDNRGTGARGREWRKVVYRQLGVVETRDLAAAGAGFGRMPFVDPARIGIWGWSYGGFMSLNALFQAPAVYRAAIAVAPVTHWSFYDNIYTERYNGLPRENREGYDKGSPLSYAAGLQGSLLLVHGTGDDNVHFQNTEALVNALIAAGKQFDLMIYPDRNHSISGGNTSLHLYGLMTRYLDEHLKQGGDR